MRDIVMKALAAAVAAGFVVLGVGAASASLTASVDLRNIVPFDTVDIEIGREGGDEPKLIYDDAEAVSSARIVNKGAACWIRAQARLTQGDGTPVDGDLFETEPSDEAWLPAGDGWYYLTRSLGEGESVAFSVSVSNPYGADWDGSGFDLASTIVAEAVQAEAFEPDFEAESPWGDIKAEASLYARQKGEGHESDE